MHNTVIGMHNVSAATLHEWINKAQTAAATCTTMLEYSNAVTFGQMAQAELDRRAQQLAQQINAMM